MYLAFFKSGNIAGSILKLVIFSFVASYLLRLVIVAVKFVSMWLSDRDEFNRFITENDINALRILNPFSNTLFSEKEAADGDEQDDEEKRVLCKATAKVIGKEEIKTYVTDEEGRPTTVVSYRLKVKFYVGNSAATAYIGSVTYDDTVEIYYNKDNHSEVYLTSDDRFKTGFTMADFTVEGLRNAKNKAKDKVLDAVQKNAILNILLTLAMAALVVLATKLNNAL